MIDPVVSVIVPAYNAEHFLAEALDSALTQSFSDLEIIVVDDGSTDATAAVAERYAAAHPSRVRLIRQANQGMCGARNTALACARGRFVALLDADDAWLPHHLAASVHLLERNADAGLVHANIELIDMQGKALQIPKRYWNDTANADPFAALLLRNEHVSCPTAVFRRDLLNRIGSFDDRFNRLGCEDRDLWLRIAQVTGLVFLPAVHARYRVHSTSLSANFDKMHRARMLLIDKFAATPQGRRLRRKAAAAAHAGLGDALIARGDSRQALVSHVRALMLSPGNLRVWKCVARDALNFPVRRLGASTSG